jgi:subtilisin
MNIFNHDPNKKDNDKFGLVSLLGLITFTSTIAGAISFEPAFSQSSISEGNTTSTSNMGNNTILQSSPEGEKIVSQNPIFDVIPGQDIKPIFNSIIVELKPLGEVGVFNDTVEKLTSNITSVGGNVSGIYDQINMFNIKFDVSKSAENNVTISKFIENLKNNPNVQTISNDGFVTIQAPQILPNDQNRVDADLSPTKSGDGTGVVTASIAIVDTGVQADHPDLNVDKCLSFIGNPTPGVPINSCADGHGHGTHVAGTAAALDNDLGVVGKAPGAKIWAIKVLSDTGSGTFSDILEAINYIASKADEIDVVNMSIGGGGTSPPLENAITNLVDKKGVIVVVSAGGSNSDAQNFTPARTPSAITVSAMADTNGKCGGGGPDFNGQTDDSFASSSNHGPVIDIASPGVGIYSTYKNSSYATMSGTSMASANVAGAAALYKSLNPSATPSQVDNFLKTTGTKSPTSGDPLKPCDGNGKGYFNPANDDDSIREPLLYMANNSKSIFN